MIVTPRANEVIDVLRYNKDTNSFIEIDEVFLWRRQGGAGATWHKHLYWQRQLPALMPTPTPTPTPTPAPTS